MSNKEGVIIAKHFLDYVFRNADKFWFSSKGIVESCKQYAANICKNCGGINDCTICPVNQYKADMSDFIAGRKTNYSEEGVALCQSES